MMVRALTRARVANEEDVGIAHTVMVSGDIEDEVDHIISVIPRVTRQNISCSTLLGQRVVSV
jgi:hypothetical protein